MQECGKMDNVMGLEDNFGMLETFMKYMKVSGTRTKFKDQGLLQDIKVKDILDNGLMVYVMEMECKHMKIFHFVREFGKTIR